MNVAVEENTIGMKVHYQQNERQYERCLFLIATRDLNFLVSW